MRGIDEISSYLRAAVFKEGGGGAPAGPPMPFITISRQAGAGGLTLADELMRQLRGRDGALWSGWSVLDRELCEAVANDPKLSVMIDSLKNEAFRDRLTDYLATVLANESPQSLVLARVFKTIRTAAAAGKVIVVGRAANLVTGMLRLGVHLRLVAPRPYRLRSLMKRHGWTEAQAQTRMDEMESARRLLVKTYFRKDIEDPFLYDAVINVERVPLEEAARLALTLVDRKAAAQAELAAKAG